MVPCLEDEGCDLLVNKSGWTCTQPGGRVKTTTVSGGEREAEPSTHSDHSRNQSLFDCRKCVFGVEAISKTRFGINCQSCQTYCIFWLLSGLA